MRILTEPCVNPSGIVITASKCTTVTAEFTSCIVVPEIDIVVVTSGQYPFRSNRTRNRLVCILIGICRRNSIFSNIISRYVNTAAYNRCNLLFGSDIRIIVSVSCRNIFIFIVQVKFRSLKRFGRIAVIGFPDVNAC